MTQIQVKIVDAETGEEIIRDANAAELEQIQADALFIEELNEIEADAIAAKADAQAKLAALGLTTEDLKALGL
jgi:hypothetical protein